MRYEPLRPRWYHLLRVGLPKARDMDARKVMDRSGEMPVWVERGYEHQSTKRLVWHLMVEAKSQRVWSREQLLAELLDTENAGGLWLRRQVDPVATFDELWAAAYQHAPQWSVEQATTLLLDAIERTPGIQLVRLRELVGWNRGRLDGLLNALVQGGALREERTYGPSGTQVTSRRFYRVGRRPVVQVAKGVATAVSLSLLAMSATTAMAATATTGAKGHRTTEGSDSVSFVQALTDKKIRDRGKRVYLWMAAKTRERVQARERHRRQRTQARYRLSELELAHITEGIAF